MNRNRLISLAALLVLPFAPGCYVYHDHGGSGGGGGVYTPAGGDVTFFWAFEGASCYREPDIQYVHITIPGESLDAGGYYDCNNAGSDGIKLHNFVGGSYNFQIEAIDFDGYPSYYGSGSFTVDGNTRVDVNLTLR